LFASQAREEVKLISQNWKQNLTAQEVTTLVNIMKTFLDAADYYAKVINLLTKKTLNHELSV
jgi:hypothetical protein